MKEKIEIAILGGGCFWCTEAVFSLIKGVKSVTSGYAGGHTRDVSYEAVSMGRTGHAEVVKVEFDPRQVTYDQLLEVFFAAHDPTTLNRQGADVGTQYRSVIFTTTSAQEMVARKLVAAIQSNVGQKKKVTTQVEELDVFHDAETYHQKYYEKNSSAPYCSGIIAPKLDKLYQQFPNLMISK